MISLSELSAPLDVVRYHTLESGEYVLAKFHHALLQIVSRIAGIRKKPDDASDGTLQIISEDTPALLV